MTSIARQAARLLSAASLSALMPAALLAQTAAPPPASSQPVPGELELAKLIWSTMAAVDHANQSGNYSVLRDISAPAFPDRQRSHAAGADFRRAARQRHRSVEHHAARPHLPCAAGGYIAGRDPHPGLFRPAPDRHQFRSQAISGWRASGSWSASASRRRAWRRSSRAIPNRCRTRPRRARDDKRGRGDRSLGSVRFTHRADRLDLGV